MHLNQSKKNVANYRYIQNWSGPQEFKVKEGLKVSEGKRALKGFEVQGQEQNRSNKADKR